MNDILSMNTEELNNVILQQSEKAFRAGQVFSWLHEKCAVSYDEMTNVPSALREALSETYPIYTVSEVQLLRSKDGTVKYLFRLHDGNVIESVLMKYEYGYSVCISSQAGCKMGCKFCASTIGGKVRDLTAGEMLSQIYTIQRQENIKISHVVIMGTGEPLDNFENFLRFIELITSQKGQGLSARSITASTCGLVDKMRELADMKLQITLAVSLHAPNDDIRKQIMPVAFQHDFNELMKACDYYFEKTGRRITFEYSLIKGVNDSEECAIELSKKLAKKNCHVNLIPVNPVKERDYRRSDDTGIHKFKNILEKNRINVTIRREIGSDINAACGQLRRSYEESQREQ